MQKVIHQSWRDLAARAPEADRSIVAFDFAGTFTQGSYDGTQFAGRIHYDRTAAPTEHHESFAIYEEWPSPIVKLAVGGQIMTAHGAAVYDGIFDGHEGHFDFVNMFGTGPFNRVEEMAFFEILFAAEDASALADTSMPTAQQLLALPVKQMSFGTNEPGNVMSCGDFRLIAVDRFELAPRLVEAPPPGAR